MDRSEWSERKQSENEWSKCKQSESKLIKSELSKSELSKSCYSGILSLLRPAITTISTVWMAPVNLSSITSWTGQLTNRDKRMVSRGMPTGSMAHLEWEKRH